MKGITGTIVLTNISNVSICFWYEMYCFLMSGANQRPNARAKAPVNIPTTTEDTPKDVANTARAPAPATQSGQWASAVLGITKAKIATKRSSIFFMIS